jgi:hypothetical protein
MLLLSLIGTRGEGCDDAGRDRGGRRGILVTNPIVMLARLRAWFTLVLLSVARIRGALTLLPEAL